MRWMVVKKQAEAWRPERVGERRERVVGRVERARGKPSESKSGVIVWK